MSCHKTMIGVSRLGKHLLDLLIAQENLMDRLVTIFQRDVVVVERGRQKDLGIPGKALAR